MTVHFIGAGPGAPDLITVRGLKLIQRCPVCLYAGSLVPAEVVAEAPAGARVIDTAPLHLEEIMAEIQAAHAAGQDVARVHSGDPSLYGAISEQIRRLDALGIPWTITPGVPAFAATGATLCIHLSINNLVPIVRELTPILGADTPVAVVYRATWPDQRIIRGTLASIREQVKAAGITRTALIMVGRVLGEAAFSESRLYAADHSHVLRPSTPASQDSASGTEPAAPAGG
jgi:precorrin-4/cobalt-precorrin-4 C11-methyltransferase